MSFKYAAQRISDGHYVLPKVADMRVEAHAFLSDRLYQSSEETVWDQLRNAATYEGVIDAYLMPDGHMGFGVPIGSVVVTEDTIIQAGSGYDISCGVLYMAVPGLTAGNVRGKHKRKLWIQEIEKRVALGLGSHRPELMPSFTLKQLDDILRFGAKPLGVDADLCERQFIPVPEGTDFTKIGRAYDKALPQLGSLGGGNHFIELQVDQDTGEAFVMVHCGSRGFGWQIANHFFFAGAELRGLPKNRREDSWLRRDEPLGKEYWAYHNAAANYAIANRHIIVRGIREALQEVFNVDGEVFYEISHNLVQEETLASGSRGLVHRKGATRALSAGHPDLAGTKWADIGHPCLIPGSMFDGAAILTPGEGARTSGFSVNHGSGRLLGRGKAKRKFASQQDRIDNEMGNVQRDFAGVQIEGIVMNTKKTPLDECARVYKDLDEVLAVLAVGDIARVDRRLYPVANLKG